MKRVVVSAVIVLAVVGGALIAQASSASATVTSPVITFDDAAQQVTLTIPTPACPTSDPGCQWKFFLNEPKLSVDVSTVYGTSGTLTLAYPKDFCGVIQADAYVGPPWVAKRGFQHTIEDCTPAPPVTPPAPPSGPPVVVPTAAPVSPAPPVTTPTSPTTTAAPVTPTTAPAVAAVNSEPSTTTPAPAHVSAASQLPFTGLAVQPLLVVGLSLVLLGLGLLFARRPKTS